MKISAVYKITNTITGDFYVGSSKNVKQRWANHKSPSIWKQHPNNPMYLDMKKFGADKFSFEILAEVEIDSLKETEQRFIEILKPIYNSYNAKGWNFKRYKKCQKKANKEYKEYNKYKEYQKQYQKQYENQLCFYNGEVLKLHALYMRFTKAGIPHPTAEAKKYLIRSNND